LKAIRKFRFDAIVTPLSSIFGSGFLVIVPILAEVAGKYSVVAMALVCAVAFAVGSVIRFNIAHAEPALAAGQDKVLFSLERGRRMGSDQRN
jgi:glycerol uptake facilitator-like aquaporin